MKIPRLRGTIGAEVALLIFYEGGCCHTSHSHNSLSQFTNVTPVSVCHYSLLCEIPNDVKPGEAWATKKRASTPEVKKFKKWSRSPRPLVTKVGGAESSSFRLLD